jgi:pectinesterase
MIRRPWSALAGLAITLAASGACSSSAPPSDSQGPGFGAGSSSSGGGVSGSSGSAATGSSSSGTAGGSSGPGGSNGGSSSSGTIGGSSGVTGSSSSGGSGGPSSSGSGSGSGAVDAGGARDGGSSGGGSGGGSSSSSSSSSGGGVDAGPVATSTATRPQLTDSQAASDTILNYLAQAGTIGALVTDNWNPTAGLGDATTFTPNFTVASDGTGTHTTVQAAITAAAGVSGAARVFIQVKPGTYRELVCIRAGSTPITLFSTNTDATQTVIVFNNFAGGPPTPANPCNPSTGTTLGTFSSATLMAFANGFQAKNLTISNDYAATASGTGQQAVALMTQADKVVLENVRVLSFQDTLFFHTSAVTTVSRVYMKNSFVQGDTDFIFGRATAVLDGGTINYVSSRRGGSGTIVAPSTDPHNTYGFLVFGVNFTQSGTLTNSVYLGRAWDNGVASAAAYVAGTSPNGQALVSESALGGHIRTVDPWAAAATSARPFSATGNRLFEYRNSGAGAAP